MTDLYSCSMCGKTKTSAASICRDCERSLKRWEPAEIVAVLLLAFSGAIVVLLAVIFWLTTK